MVTKAAKELEEEAKKIIDCYLVKIEGEGERVEYKDFEKIIIETIIAYGLEEKALTKGVEIAFSSDGADFTRICGHTSTGFQILDIGSKYPGTNILIFDDGFDEKGNKKMKSYHTKDICNFLCMSQVKETKEHYKETIKHVFKFMNKCASDGKKQRKTLTR